MPTSRYSQPLYDRQRTPSPKPGISKVIEMKIEGDETLDILCKETLKIIQKKDGYRFSIDAILLSSFVTLKKYETLLDIGTGCGIVPIYMSKKGLSNPMLGIEIQDELFITAQKNKELNKCENVRFMRGDIKLLADTLKKSFFHVIVSNPPYTKERTGRQSPKQSRLIARYESQIDLETLLSISSALLDKKGRLYLIYPSRRLGELVYAAKKHRLEPRRLRFIHPKREETANLFLAELIKEGGTEVTIEKPLYIYDNDRYTEEVESYYLL
jgi:tRNA1Val (adenine37-N6)-methyltransferase